jgi:hypothetical protein
MELLPFVSIMGEVCVDAMSVRVNVSAWVRMSYLNVTGGGQATTVPTGPTTPTCSAYPSQTSDGSLALHKCPVDIDRCAPGRDSWQDWN